MKLSEKQDKLVARIGRELLSCQADLFELWPQYKQGCFSRWELIRKTQSIRHKVGALLEQGTYIDPKLRIVRFSSNLLTHFDALWTFIFNDNVEPTNNHAEQCLLPAVIWRKNYFGTRSDYGSDFVARTMSLITSCRLQAKSAFDVCSQILSDHFSGRKSLLFANLQWPYVFLKAAKDNNVNALYLVAHALHESDAGDSPLAKESKNFFGLGAKDRIAKTAGADFAQKHGWTTVDEGIIGGAAIISKLWINRPDKTQSTLYAMRWNPMSPGQKQYATDINWANAQVSLIYKQMKRLIQIDSSYHSKYIVPKYR